MFGQNILLNHFFVFGLCACDICSRQPARVQIRDFSGFFKTLIISRLNFTDTYWRPKTGLKGPKRACEMATVVLQLWPFRLPTVALSQVRWAWMRKAVGFSGGLRPTFHPGWRVFVEVILLIRFATIRHRELVVYSQKQACIRTQVLMHACFGGVCLPFLSPEFPLSRVQRKRSHTLFKKLSVRAEVCAVCCRGFPVGGFPVRQLTCRWTCCCSHWWPERLLLQLLPIQSSSLP